jgi:hypothetical protein
VVSISLCAQEKPEWAGVSEHLTGHPVLAALDAFKMATEQDLAARWNLAEELLTIVEPRTGLAVTLDSGRQSAGRSCLTLDYLGALYDQVFREAAGLSAYPGSPDQYRSRFRIFGDSLYFGGLGSPFASHCSPDQLNKIIDFLVNPPDKLSKSRNSRIAGAAYRHAEVRTQELNKALVDFLDEAGKEPENRCRECRPWFQGLGLE